ncbi:MAG: hypothetical protein SPF70_00310 [Lachnospiraceae bacterium]|nr:hypothetical protein [Lachnospiraceae bacterium]
MARRKEENRIEKYEAILARIRNLHLPLLTLDRKWYLLFSGGKPKSIMMIEDELNDAIKSQGRIKEEKQQLNHLKKKLMNEIVNNMNEPEDSDGFKRMEKSRDLIQEINDKLILLENDELDIPDMMREKNAELAMETMELFYDGIADELNEIMELEKWIKETREELKQKTALYDQKIRETKNITNYFDRLLGPDITHMYINYLNGIYDDDEEEDEDIL